LYLSALISLQAYKHKSCYCFLPSLNMNQVPEKHILIRNQIQMYFFLLMLYKTSTCTQSKTMKTTLVSALFRQFDSFFGTIDTIYVHCQKIYNSFPQHILIRNQIQMYFFLLMLYKTSTCKIFWLCAVFGFFHNFYSLKTFYFYFFYQLASRTYPWQVL
jgi:hypothetical protein